MSPRRSSKAAASRWEIAPPREAEAAALAAALGVPSLVAQTIVNRGIFDATEARRFLAPQLKDLDDPLRMEGMKAAATRLARAVKQDEALVIYGDYDVDGVCSTAIATRVLRALGCSRVRPFLPDRFDEGYGLGETSLARCLAEGAPDLMLVLDCGTNSRAEVAALRARGVGVVILDHHEPSCPAEPDALVNYKLGEGAREGGVQTEFCTAGLIFKCAHALLKLLRQEGHAAADRVDLRETLDLVALATVSDLAPLTRENRLLTRHGLRQMAATRHAGLRALMKVAGVKGTPTATDCGFRLGPRLNAAGRLESAVAALDLLLAENEDDAEALAARLDATNRDRQAEEQRVHEEAREDAEAQFQAPATRVLVVGRPGWHEGVVGIVASRLAREFHLPAFVIALGDKEVAKGSGRSIEGFDLAAALNATRAHLAGGGGHAMAAGVSLTPERLTAWREALQEHARGHPLFREGRPRRKSRADAEVRLADVTLDLVSALEKIEPCGCGNPRPAFVARGVEVDGMPRAVGRNGEHLKFRARQGGVALDAIAFGRGDVSVNSGDRLDLLFEPQRNEYLGRVSAQALVLEMSRAA